MYRVRFPKWARSLSGGKERLAEAFECKEEGEEWVADWKHQIKQLKARGQAKKRGNVAEEDPPFAAAVEGFLEDADIRPKTRKCYIEVFYGHLNPHFSAMPMGSIGRDAILAYLKARKEAGASPSALKRDVTHLRLVLNWARKAGALTDPTAWDVKKPKAKPTITRRFDPAVMDAFLLSLTGRDRAVLEIAACTGMRTGELRAFDCSWIRWHEERIEIPHDEVFSPKDAQARSIPLHRRLTAALEQWLDGRRSGLVFPPARHGGGKGAQGGLSIRSILRKLRAKGIEAPFVGAHGLRHHFISWLAFLGLSAREIQEISGHAQLATVEGYMHVSPQYLERARTLLDRSKVGSKLGKARKVKSRSDGPERL